MHQRALGRPHPNLFPSPDVFSEATKQNESRGKQIDRYTILSMRLEKKPSGCCWKCFRDSSPVRLASPEKAQVADGTCGWLGTDDI